MDTIGAAMLVADLYGVPREDVDPRVVDVLPGVLQTLSRSDRVVVSLLYGLDDGVARTLEQIAALRPDGRSVTRQRVHQLRRRAFRRLQNPFRKRPLAPYVSSPSTGSTRQRISPYWTRKQMNKPTLAPKRNVTADIIGLFEGEIAAGRVGFGNGFSISSLCMALLGMDTYSARARVKRHLADAKWYFQGKGIVLGPVHTRLDGWRYCIVSEQWEAMAVQGVHTSHSAGNIKRMLLNEPVLQGANLLPTPLDQRLMSLAPFVDLWRALPPRRNGGRDN